MTFPVVFVTVDLYAVHLGAWFFSHQKTLGIFLDKDPLEQVLFPVLTAVMSAIITAILADKEEKGQTFMK